MIDFAGSVIMREAAGEAIIGTSCRVTEDGEATISDERTGADALIGITTGSSV